MKCLPFVLLFVTSAFAQGGGQSVDIPLPNPTFSDGYGSMVVQDLGISPSQLQEGPPGYTTEGLYTLTMPIANTFPSYPGYWKMKISFGTQDLCDGSVWGKRAQSQVTIVCPSPGYLIVDQSLDCDQNPCTSGPAGSAQGHNDLMLSVTVNGWTVLVENASLTFTPTN